MPKSVDRGQKRAELVEASWEVIAAQGLEAATLRRVSAEAGCTTGTLTHYFSDRQALLIEALRRAHYEAGERMADTARRSSSDAGRLRAVLLESLPLDGPRLREWRVWLAFWAASTKDAELARENSRRYAEWRQLLHGLVRPLAKSAAAAKREVDHLVALVDGLGLRLALHSEGELALEAETRECKATLLRHLAHLGEH